MQHAVTAEEAGARADVVVARLTGASRAAVAAAVLRGGIRIDGQAVKGSRAVELGETLEFELEAPPTLHPHAQVIPISVVYEDDDVIVVDKPAGMVTHPARGARSETLVNALLGHIPHGLPGDALRPGLIHRLDRDTSGLLVVAKSAPALAALQDAMKARRITRQYLGLVLGIPQHAHGTVAGSIGRDRHNRLRFAVTAGGKPATTHYEVRERFAKHAELEFRLETGRTHQIRVHAAAMGHPLLNDAVYGMREPRFGLPGQALHAFRLAFDHPRSHARLEFTVEPPQAYVAAREVLRSEG